MMPRFSLRQLLILVAFASVTCAALARPGYWWHAAIALAVSITAIGMVIAGIVCDSRRRAFAVGWLVLDQPPTLLDCAGIALVLIGVAAQERDHLAVEIEPG